MRGSVASRSPSIYGSYLGSDDFKSGYPKSFPPNDFYSDFEGQPQYKAHLDMTFFKEFRLWTISLENRHEFNDVFSLATVISPQYQEFERRRRPELAAVYPVDTPSELRERIGDRNSVSR